jgi:hypothetical protein
MQKNTIKIILFLLLFGAVGSQLLSKENSFKDNSYKAVSTKLTWDCRVVVAECLNAINAKGNEVWEGWSNFSCPINIVTNDYEFLIGFKKPPAEYRFLEYDKLLKTDIYFKERTFKQLLVGAAKMLSGKLTVFISTPELFISKLKINMDFYKILLIHELFHVFQINNFSGGYEFIKNLNFPRTYPYKVEINNKMRGQEGKILKKAITSKTKIKKLECLAKFLDIRMKRREIMMKKHPKSFSERHITQEKFMEWLEGQARYTEVKMGQLLRDDKYKPIPYYKKFLKNPMDIYKNEIRKLELITLNSGPESNYGLGWAQWLLLDQLFPEWKNKAFQKDFFAEEVLSDLY